jgi:fibronectin-binding autotransporter adhesin
LFDDQTSPQNGWIVDQGTGSGKVVLSVISGTAVISNNCPVTFNAYLEGPSGFTKLGTNTLILNGSNPNNTLTGPVIIAAGTLQVGNGGSTGSLGSGNVTNNAALYFDLNAIVTVANNVSGTGTVTVGGGNRLKFSGAHTESGATIIDSGSTLEVNAVASYSSNSDYTVNGVLEAWNNLPSVTIGALNGSGTVFNTGGSPGTTEFIVGANGSSGTFSGVIANGAWGGNVTGLTKTGAGIQTLSGTNIYTGNTTIKAGTLELAQSFATLATNSTVTIASGANLNLANGAVTNIVTGLVTNGVAAGNGVYGSGNSAGFITGSGHLQVGLVLGPSGPASMTNSYSGGVLSLSWPAGQGWRLQMQTNSLAQGLGTNWVYVTDGSVSATNITVDATKPTVFYRLTYP